MIEGLENPEKPETKKKHKTDTLSDSYIEGLTQKAKELSDQQGGLLEMTKQLGPMMAQAEKMMNRLPEGFLDAALEKFKTTNLKK